MIWFIAYAVTGIVLSFIVDVIDGAHTPGSFLLIAALWPLFLVLFIVLLVADVKSNQHKRDGSR